MNTRRLTIAIPLILLAAAGWFAWSARGPVTRSVSVEKAAVPARGESKTVGAPLVGASAAVDETERPLANVDRRAGTTTMTKR